MVPRFRRWLLSLVAAGLCLLTSCFGVSHNPSYFPDWMPFGDIVRTHGKPGGPAYFRNFDPHAVHLEVRPLESASPVGTHYVVLATVYDEKGQPRRNRRVEWMLEGAGNIVEVDESGIFSGRGYKVDNRYAVSYTDFCEHTITRGNNDPNDDFTVRPGQSWCVISSAVEGDTHVTVYCPEIHNWDQHKVTVVKHWVNADWIFPPPVVVRAGVEQPLVTRISRHSDHQPLANYRVRYRILDGPPAYFAPEGTQEALLVSGLEGQANVTITQASPAMGVNRIGVEIIRPPEPATPGGVGLVIARGTTTVEWQAPAVTLVKNAPTAVVIGQELPYALTVSNVGQVESHALTVRDIIPEGLQYVRSDPPASLEGNHLVWTLGELGSRQSRMLHAIFRTTRIGPVTNQASVETEDGIRKEHAVTTQVTPEPQPQLQMTMVGPETGQVDAPIRYAIHVSNPGSGPASNVVLSARFDPGLEHTPAPGERVLNVVQVNVGVLAAGESKVMPLTLIPRRSGTLVNRVTATAAGNLTASAEHAITVRRAELAVRISGSTLGYIGRQAHWRIQVSNQGETALNHVALRHQLPTEVEFVNASADGQREGTQVLWNLGTLLPGEQKTVETVARCEKLAIHAVHQIQANDDSGVQARQEAVIEIRGIPAFRKEAESIGNPTIVGGKVTQKFTVENQGSLPANEVVVVARISPKLRVLDARGPSKPTVDGSTVTFAPVNDLPPKGKLVYTIELEAVEAGDGRVQFELSSSTLSSPVIDEQSIQIKAMKEPSRPAPPGAAPAEKTITTTAPPPDVR